MNVPQLRFDGFDGEWGPKTIKDLGIIGRGKSKHRPRNDTRLYGTDYPFVQTSDIKNAGLYLNSYSQAYSEFGLKQSKLWSKGTLCITIAANIAETTILDIEACFPDSIIGFTPNPTESEVVFIKKYFEFINPTLQKMSEGVAQSNLNLEKLASIEFATPSLMEQKKIASFFMLVEKKIEKQQEKIEKLEQFKKGMMQKIFSQELRFKDEDGGEFGEWIPTTFHKVADIRRGASPRPIADPKWFSATSKIGWLRISDVTASGVYLKEVTQYLSEEGIKKSVLLEEPHLILSIAATIGKPVINKIPLCIHDGFIVFKNLKLDMLFGYYYLEHFQDKWLQFRQPGSQFNLNSDLVGNLNIMIPSRKEQETVAKFFSAIDTKIEKEKEKLMVLEEQKKGFMQGMFV